MQPKNGEPMKMPFGLRARMGHRNHVLDWGPEVLTDVAMAIGNQFWDGICYNWLYGL